MPKLVAPDGIMYVINDTGPRQADVAALEKLRPDLPKKNRNQLLRWTPGPHKGRGIADDWQLLDNVRWAEKNGEYIPLVGSATNALKIFNRHCGTSHILNDSFRKLLSGARELQGWKRMPDGQIPAPAMSLADGSSLVGLRQARTLAQARAANAALVAYNCADVVSLAKKGVGNSVFAACRANGPSPSFSTSFRYS